MKTYHGCRIENVKKLENGKTDNIFGLYVTDRFELAARYANTQATKTICEEITAELNPLAAVIELETEEEINYNRREASHNTLDICEAKIKTWTIFKITVKKSDYCNSYGNKVIEQLSKKYNVEII